MSKGPHDLYNATFQEFLNTAPESVFGALCAAYHGEMLTSSREAWQTEITIMRHVLGFWQHEAGHIVFEYDIPRLSKRIDTLLLFRGIIFCLEFKVGKKNREQADIEQVLDYALDLKNFHLMSANRKIVPILIPTKFRSQTTLLLQSAYDDNVYNPITVGADGLQRLLQQVITHEQALPDAFPFGGEWLKSPYSPTPTIIEAARALYEHHNVDNITRHEADKVSTDATIAYLLDVIAQSKAKSEKSICFVTGVPGAGKTLVGLDVAVKQTYKDGEKPSASDGAVYLSGNGPLVAVLQEALARDNVKSFRQKGIRKNLTDAKREVKEFIQIIHQYRDNMIVKIKNPVENGVLEIDKGRALKLAKTGYGEVEHVAIFDEAQRSWTQNHLANYLKRGGTYGNKLKVPNFPLSEAAFLIWALDQREDWAVIVCLVGGGQEINTGEAGIGEWIKALNDHFTHWKVYISDKLTDKEYAEGRVKELLEANKQLQKTYSDKLHLAVSLRSFRAEKLSAFVHSLLSFAPETKNLLAEIAERYPIYLTRSMDTARQWLRCRARGSQRTGILITKTAARYKPLAVDVVGNSDADTVHWFLEDKSDVRSSNYLEDAATEIQVQGLELDWTCVLWDADVRSAYGQWNYYKFNGRNAWIPEKDKERQQYMLNAYRVLLTRARIGMIICVPAGNARKMATGEYEDATRLPAYYDETYEYLKSIGLKEVR